MFTVRVNTLGPVGMWEFTQENNRPSLCDNGKTFFVDNGGVEHVFHDVNVVHIGYYPVKKPKVP